MNIRQPRFTKVILASALVLSLAACDAVSGRETTGQYVDDATISTKVRESYVADPVIKSMEVHVETLQGVVELSGFVDTRKQEDRAVALARKVKGVQSVQDNLIVRND
jgi:osmotically-inducible protein OsmY